MELWEESLRRSRERRELAAARGPELPAKGLSVAALVALAGVPATGVAAGKLLGGGGQGGAGAAVAGEPALAVEHRATEASRPQGAPPEAQPAMTKRATTTASRPALAAKRGRDGGVTALQRALGLPVDGDFGPRTERALERWQRGHGLPVDGVLGPQTRAALGLDAGAVLKRARPGRGGHRHRAHRRSSVRVSAASRLGGVRGLQRALGVSGDGVFGPSTERALKRWQRAHGLTPDGVAGPETRARLGLGDGKLLERRADHRGGHRSGRGGGGGGGGSSAVQRVIAAASEIATKPYKYGGGHGSFTDSGYDCSGSVSYALHGGGLLSSPLDSSGFMSYGAPGPGRHITIYANPGHVYMTVDGRRFDTSARSQTGSRWSGSGRGRGGYVVRHPRGL